MHCMASRSHHISAVSGFVPGLPLPRGKRRISRRRFFRLTYFTILLSHTLLATLAVWLVTLTLIRALRYDFARHARIAQITFPIWLYVSITGVVIYVMLYHLPVAGG